MKIKQHFFLFSAFCAYVFLSHSCANQGAGPTGGPKDSIPPTIVGMIPEPFATNVSSNEISISFDEYVVPDNLSNKMVVSPPLAEKPTIKVKGKTIHIKFNEDLIPNRTYSVDLKDGVKDYNEGNKIESIRMLFSTYENIDTLRIKGYLLDAYTLVPVKDAYATLYTLNEDSVFSTLRPDFIAKTDDKGFFLFDNLPAGNYKLYGLMDGDNNLLFSQETEQIAFVDSFIVPSAQFVVSNDTIIQGNDTLISTGHTQYWPDPVYVPLFLEDNFKQYITSSKREKADQMLVTFNESLTDSFHFDLANIETFQDWNYTEFSANRDSVIIWLNDTLLIQNDSLLIKVDFTTTDSIQQFITKTDTLKMFFSHQTTKSKAKKKDEGEPKEQNFEFVSNITSNNFDLNKSILIEASMPVELLDSSMIELALAINDSVWEPVPFTFNAVENSKRKFEITYQPVEASKYKLSIDSAVVYTKTRLSNLPFESVFKTQKADYYGNAIFEISGISERAKIQLLQNSEKEGVVTELYFEPGTKTITFNYLKPNKYRVKLLVDKNGNGKWDTGNLSKKVQPEPVYYYSKIINVKSNWDMKENWVIDPNVHQLKDLVDDDKKKDEEK